MAGNELTDTTSAPAVRSRSSSSTKSASGPTRRLTAERTLPGSGTWRSGCAGSAGTCSADVELTLGRQERVKVLGIIHGSDKTSAWICDRQPAAEVRARPLAQPVEDKLFTIRERR